MGEFTFREVFENFNWNLNVSVTVAKSNEPILLNYLTAPNVLVWSAVVASCALPGAFTPTELLMKTMDGKKVPYHPSSSEFVYNDGSLMGDLPMRRLSELFNVNTFLVSQVNPHIVPFISEDNSETLEFDLYLQAARIAKGLVGSQLRCFIESLNTLGLIPNSLKSISHQVSQSKKGHVTVVPSPSLREYSRLMSNYSVEEFWDAF